MGPKKRTKTKSARSVKDVNTVDPWVKDLVGKTINDDKWRCHVTIMFESNSTVTFYNKLLGLYTADRKNLFRKNIQILSYNDLMQSVIFDQVLENVDSSKDSQFQMGSKKRAKTKSTRSGKNDKTVDPLVTVPYNKLCSQLHSTLSDNSFDRKKITPLLASFIKYKILAFKEKSIEQLKFMEEYRERERLDEEENRIKFEECKSNKDQQVKTKKKPTPKKSSQKSKRKTVKKEEVWTLTTLKRGQEFLEAVDSIENEPEDGPQMHVVLTGFLEPNLPLELLALGVPLVGILKLKPALITSDNSHNLEDQNKIIERLKLAENIFDSSSKLDTQEKDDNIFQHFWRDFYVSLINYENDDKFENVVFHPFPVTIFLEDHSKTDSGNIISNLSKQVYDHISQVQYNINEIIEKRLDYLGRLKMNNMEESIKKTEIDVSEYDRLMNSIPPACVQVYHILEAILQQVTMKHEKIQSLMNDEYEGAEQKMQSFFDENYNNSINGDISREVSGIFSGLESHICELEEIYDLLSVSLDNTETLGKVDEQGVVFEYEDKFGIEIYQHKKDQSTLHGDSIKLLKHFWRTHLSIDVYDNDHLNFHEPAPNKPSHYDRGDYVDKTSTLDLSKTTSNERNSQLQKNNLYCNTYLDQKSIDYSKNNHSDPHESVSNKSNHYRTNSSDKNLSDSNKQFRKSKAIGCSFLRGSHSKSKSHRENLEENDYFPLDENIYKKLCLIPCGFQNIFLEEKKMNFCLDAPNLYDINSECKDCAIDQSENNDFSKFFYSEICAELTVQNLFNSLEEYECVDIETDNEGFHYVKFHTNCCYPEKTLKGSLRTAVCLRDFFDFIIPEITSQSDPEINSLTEYTTIVYDNKLVPNKSDDHWCLDEDFIDANSLKRRQSMRFIEENVLNNSLAENREHDAGTDNEALLLDNRTMLDAFEFNSLKFLNFTERKQQFRFSKTFTARIRILSHPFNNDFVSIEPSINDYTMYFYVGLRQKVNDVKFHIIHKSGMIVYFERVAIPIRDSKRHTGLVSGAETFNDVKSQSEPISEECQDTSTYFKKLSYRFSLSWPSCMHLEFFNGSEMCPVYVKQWYSIPSTHPELVDEEMRCYTTNGEILKYMKDKSVIVYYPNGRIFRHTQTSLFRNSKNSDELSDDERRNFNPNEYKYEQAFQDFTDGTSRVELSNGVAVTQAYNGDLIVDFPDGSRITSRLNCEIEATDSGDKIFENDEPSSNNDNNESSGNNDNNNKYYYDDNNEPSGEEQFSKECEESFVLITTHYLIEHEFFASVSTNGFGQSTMKIGLPLNLGISIDKTNDMFVVEINDESRIEVERNEINIFNGNSIQSTIHLSNIQEYSDTFPQYERYDFFNCKVDSKSVLLLDSWGEIHTNRQYFCSTYLHELDNMYYIVKDDLYGYKVYPSDFETKVNQLTDSKSVIKNECVSSKHKSALFIGTVEASDWRMKFEPFYVFERSQSTRGCCRLFWLDPITTLDKNKTIIDAPPLLLKIGLIQWLQNGHNIEGKVFRTKSIYDSILKNKDYRAAIEIYEKGNQIFVSERQHVIEQAKRIVSETLNRVQSFFARNKRLKKIDRFKEILRHDSFCNYFNTKQGITFLVADKVVTDALKITEPKETAKLISSSVAEDLIKCAMRIVEQQVFKKSVEASSLKIIENHL